MLFPDVVPVSEQEVKEWLDNVPTLSALPSRREAYRKAYNIEEKIRTQKTEALKRSDRGRATI